MKTETDPTKRTLFLNGVELVGETTIWPAISRHIYRPQSFQRKPGRWQTHARRMAPAAPTHQPCPTQTAASA